MVSPDDVSIFLRINNILIKTHWKTSALNTTDGCKINLLTILKNVSCEYDLFEWLKINFATCVVHQPRALSAP